MDKFIFNEGVSCVSPGSFTDLTVFTKTNMNNNWNKVTLFDLQHRSVHVLTQVNLKSNIIKSPGLPNPVNTQTSNFYLDEWVNGSIYSNNFTIQQRALNTASEQLISLVSCFGGSHDYYYVGKNKIGESILHYFQMNTLIKEWNFPNSEFLEIFYEGGKIISFQRCYNLASDPGYLKIMVFFKQPSVAIGNITFSEMPSEVEWACSEFYIAVYKNSVIQIFKFDGEEILSIKNITFLSAIDSMILTNVHLIISYENKIRQYEIETGKTISIIINPFNMTNVTVNLCRGANVPVIWKYGETWATGYGINNDFNCDNVTFPECISPDEVLPPEEPLPDESQVVPDEPEVDSGIQPIEPQDPIVVDDPDQIDQDNSFHSSSFFCLTEVSGYCQTVCVKSCQKCSNKPQLCGSCSDFYEKNQNGECYLSFKNQIFVGAIAVLNVLKFTSSQGAYGLFIFDGLEFYNFHKKSYDGIFQEALQFLDFVEDNVWSMIPASSLISFLDKPFPFTNYNAYTNPQFLQKRRKDSLFFQNTKKYFLIALPVSTLIFLVFNKLFSVLSKYKIKKILKSFSFGLQLGLMLCIQNISMLNYYFLQNLKTIFSLDLQSKLLNFAVLYLYGFFIIFCIIFLPLAYNLYKKYSAYFLDNCKANLKSIIFSFLKYVLRPLVEGCIHIFLFQNQTLQLALLALTSLLFLIITLVFELNYGFFQNKASFAFTCIIELCLILLNFSLMLQINQDELMKNLMNEIITILMFIFVSCAILLFIYPLCYSIICGFCEFLKKRKVKIRNLIKKQLKLKNTNKIKYQNKHKFIYIHPIKNVLKSNKEIKDIKYDVPFKISNKF